MYIDLLFKQLIITVNQDVSKPNYFLLLLASLYEDLVGRFQLALYRHYNTGGEPIYDADQMETFANIHAPTLFTQLLNSITNRNSAQSKERNELQRKRPVVLLHIMSYFR